MPVPVVAIAVIIGAIAYLKLKGSVTAQFKHGETEARLVTEADGKLFGK